MTATAIIRALSPALLALVVLAACGGPEESPEARIRQLISDGETAAESRDISALGDLVAGDYQDARGYDRRTVLRIAQGLFLRNREIHLFSLVRDLRVEGESASARVLVAMSGRPIESAQALLSINADLVRFDVELAREDGDWLVRSTDWRRAEVNDFL